MYLLYTVYCLLSACRWATFDPTVVNRENAHFTAGHFIPRHTARRGGGISTHLAGNIPAPAGNAPAKGREYPRRPGDVPKSGREYSRQPVTFPKGAGIFPPAGNITVGPAGNKTFTVTFPASGGNIPGQPVTFPKGAGIFPPAGNITVGPAGNKTVTVILPASGGNIPGRPVILPGLWDVLPRTGSPKAPPPACLTKPWGGQTPPPSSVGGLRVALSLEVSCGCPWSRRARPRAARSLPGAGNGCVESR